LQLESVALSSNDIAACFGAAGLEAQKLAGQGGVGPHSGFPHSLIGLGRFEGLFRDPDIGERLEPLVVDLCHPCHQLIAGRLPFGTDGTFLGKSRLAFLPAAAALE